MTPKKIYLNYVDESDPDKTWSEEPVSVCDCKMKNREYTDLSQVWHDASEEPKGDEWHIAYIDVFGSIYSLKCPSVTFATFPSLAEFAAGIGMQYWAYIDDLLPKGGEK